MKRSLWLWQLMGFAVTALGGTVLHFLYEWLGDPVLIAPFSGVNESTWEHMKLLFWPMLAFTAVEAPFFRDRGDFFTIKLRGILLGLSMIPLLFYGYNGIIGKSPDFINLVIFFISAAAAYAYEYRLLRSDKELRGSKRGAILALGFIALLFIVFTFAPPALGIFKDPLTGSYGI